MLGVYLSDTFSLAANAHMSFHFTCAWIFPLPSQQATWKQWKKPPDSIASKDMTLLQGKCQLGIILSHITMPLFFFLVWWTCLYPGWVSHSRSCSGAQHHVKTSLVHAVERVTWNAWPSAAFTASDKDGWVTLRKCKFFVFSHVRLELLRKREKTRQQQTLCREKFSSFPAELYHFISTTAPQKARLN